MERKVKKLGRNKRNDKSVTIARRVLSLGLTMGMLLLAVGCGMSQPEVSGGPAKEPSATDAEAAAQTDELEQDLVYRAESISLELDAMSYSGMKQIGDALYYSEGSFDETEEKYLYHICKYSVSDGRTELLPIISSGSPTQFDFGEDGSFYADVMYWGGESGETGEWLEKYDASGKQVYRTDLNPWTDSNNVEENGYVVNVCADDEGRVCIACAKKILLFDENGKFLCVIDPFDGRADGMLNRVSAVGRGQDGKVYVCIADDSMKCTLAEINFADRKTETVTENFLLVNGNSIHTTGEKDLLAGDSSAVYRYNMTKGETKKLFAWTDIGLKGERIMSVGALSDGRLLAVEYDWSESRGDILLLTGASADEAPQKEELVMATVCGGVTVLENAVAEFNKNSDQYHITIKKYADGPWSVEASEEAKTKLNLELVAGKGPDLIDFDFLYSGVLARQGFLEDLTPYLEKSTVVSADDFVGNTLEACMVNGELFALPKQFTVSTVVGRASDVGTDPGWTVEEFMDVAEKHPGVQLLYYPGKYHLMWFCIPDCFDYVDRETGICRFDSPEFIRILEFADRYGDAAAPDSDMAYQEQVQRGEILLLESYIDEFEKIQTYNEIFEGEPCVIGFPTLDGSPNYIVDINAMCAISVNSAHKEGAWAFLESFVTTGDTKYIYAFPAVRSQLEKQMQEAMARETDRTATYGGPGGWTITYPPLTKEDTDQMMEIIDMAKARPSGDSEIGIIIGEEVSDFFEGNKPAEEVAKVIQRRVQLYLNETQ